MKKFLFFSLIIGISLNSFSQENTDTLQPPPVDTVTKNPVSPTVEDTITALKQAYSFTANDLIEIQKVLVVFKESMPTDYEYAVKKIQEMINQRIYILYLNVRAAPTATDTDPKKKKK